MNGNSKVIAIFGQNPILFILMCCAIVLLVILLISLLLFSRSKRYRQEAEEKRQSATQALVKHIPVDDDIQTIRSGSIEEVDDGVDNMAFERDHKDKPTLQKKPKNTKSPPILHFPLPPLNRPTSSSSR